MSEKQMRQKVVKALKSLDAIAVENLCYPGTPDINYVNGWMELKYLHKWPLNSDERPIQVPHYTMKQRAWHRKRILKGGLVFVLFLIDKDWFLFSGDVAAQLVGKMNKCDFFKESIAYWNNKLDEAELLECLKKK